MIAAAALRLHDTTQALEISRMTRTLKSGLLALALAATALSGTVALAKEVVIGTATYNYAPVRDTINIGGRAGQFKAVRMEVRQSDVEILDLKIVYGNGSGEDIKVRQMFKAGSSSREIDLAGKARAIKQIIVTYLPKGPAKILFYGVEAGKAANWEPLGCKVVGFGVDKDTIEVGRKEGAFSSIKLKVKQAPIEFFAVRVVFGNGQRQDIKINQKVPAGSESNAIDLAGDARGIQRVDLLYRSLPTFKGKAEVCVDGRQK
jgi:hypothetical protein